MAKPPNTLTHHVPDIVFAEMQKATDPPPSVIIVCSKTNREMRFAATSRAAPKKADTNSLGWPKRFWRGQPTS